MRKSKRSVRFISEEGETRGCQFSTEKPRSCLKVKQRDVVGVHCSLHLEPEVFLDKLSTAKPLYFLVAGILLSIPITGRLGPDGVTKPATAGRRGRRYVGAVRGLQPVCRHALSTVKMFVLLALRGAEARGYTFEGLMAAVGRAGYCTAIPVESLARRAVDQLVAGGSVVVVAWPVELWGGNEVEFVGEYRYALVEFVRWGAVEVAPPGRRGGGG